MDSSRFPMIELRHLSAFVAVAEEAHFGRAAARLDLTQPRVTMLLQRLEHLVGARLLDRRPHIRLTPAGEAFLPHAAGAVSGAAIGLEALRRRVTGLDGTLRLGFPTWVIGTGVADAVAAYRAAFPAVAIELLDLGTAAQMEQVRSNRLSLGFVRRAPFQDDELVLESLFTEEWKLVVPTRHPLAAAPHVALRDLADRPFIGFPESVASDVHQEFSALFAGCGYSPRIVQEAQEWLAIVGLVRAGAGIALVPACVEALCAHGLHYCSLPDLHARSIVCTCVSRTPDPATRSFLAFVRESLGRAEARDRAV